jgi:uncharacterized membrane protein YcaP (DUF421 family)
MHWIFGASIIHVDWAQMSARAIVIFAYGLLATRIGAWRAFGQWSPPDILVAIIIGANLSRAITGNAPLVATVVATTVFIAAYWMVSAAASRSPWLDWLFKGSAVRLIRNGEIDDSCLRRAALSRRDLDEGLRQKGVAHPSRVVAAFLERNGSITVIREEDIR